MRIRATVTALLVVATVGASLVAASGLARAQTPTATPTSVPLAACPTGTLTVTAPTAAAPTTVTATIVPALANLKAATAGDPASYHVHYFIDVPATAAGSLIPVGDAKIIHSGTLTQDLGTLAPGAHTVVVVVGQLDHRACDLRGQVSFTTQAPATATPTPGAATATAVAPVTPPSTGSGGLLNPTSGAASSPLALAALAFATALAVGGAAVATRRR